MIASPHAARAHKSMQTLRSELSAARAEIAKRMNEAATHEDDALSDEGLRAKREELREAIRVEAREYLADYRGRLERDIADLRDNVANERPKIGQDAASVMRSQAKWDQVRMRLESGMPMSKVIAGADVETPVAIREWAPAWLDARAYSARGSGLADNEVDAPDSTALLNSVDDRLAEVLGGSFHSAVTAARHGEREHAYLDPMLQMDELNATGLPNYDSGFSTVLRAHYAEQKAARTWVDPEPVAEAEGTTEPTGAAKTTEVPG